MRHTAQDSSGLPVHSDLDPRRVSDAMEMSRRAPHVSDGRPRGQCSPFEGRGSLSFLGALIQLAATTTHSPHSKATTGVMTARSGLLRDARFIPIPRKK